MNHKLKFTTFIKAIFLVPPNFLNYWVSEKIVKVSIICLLPKKFFKHYVIFVILVWKFSTNTRQFLGGLSIMNELDKHFLMLRVFSWGNLELITWVEASHVFTQGIIHPIVISTPVIIQVQTLDKGSKRSNYMFNVGILFDSTLGIRNLCFFYE